MVLPKSDLQESVTAEFVESGGLRAYLVTPGEQNGPEGSATLLLPMITGIGARVRDFAAMIAAGTGRPTLTWDPWHGRSSDDTAFPELQRLHGELGDEPAVTEQVGLLDWLAGRGAVDVGVVGWCLGGRFALALAARDRRVSAVVAYHPTFPAERPATHTIDVLAESSAIQAPVMVHYPGKDSLVPWENFTRLQTTLQARDTTAATITHVYPQAKHGFSDSARHGEQVNADAWALSWPQSLAFLTASARLRARAAV